jgi:hypothetical protein
MMGCYVMVMGKQLHTFRRNVVSSSSGSNSWSKSAVSTSNLARSKVAGSRTLSYNTARLLKRRNTNTYRALMKDASGRAIITPLAADRWRGSIMGQSKWDPWRTESDWEGFFSEYFGFPLLVLASFHYYSILIFILLLFWEWQTDQNGEPSNKATLFFF